MPKPGFGKQHLLLAGGTDGTDGTDGTGGTGGTAGTDGRRDMRDSILFSPTSQCRHELVESSVGNLAANLRKFSVGRRHPLFGCIF